MRVSLSRGGPFEDLWNLRTVPVKGIASGIRGRVGVESPPNLGFSLPPSPPCLSVATNPLVCRSVWAKLGPPFSSLLSSSLWGSPPFRLSLRGCPSWCGRPSYAGVRPGSPQTPGLRLDLLYPSD